MCKLEDLQPNAAVRGILPDSLVTVVNVQWFGSEALELTYKTPTGKVANELLYRHDEPRLEVVEQGRPWSFDGDGHLFRLVSEAHRIRLAYLFDPVLAVHTSLVDPLPHQITAVYEAMLPRQPLRFLLADDPGTNPRPAPSSHQKLFIFAEHRDTLNYLESHIPALVGHTESVVHSQHGGEKRTIFWTRTTNQWEFQHDENRPRRLSTPA
jgi:hypothetical protein